MRTKTEEIPADVVPPQVQMAAHAADLDMTFYTGSMVPQSGGILSVCPPGMRPSSTVKLPN